MKTKITDFIKVYFTSKMLLMLVLGFSSGLPLILTASTLIAWMVSSGIDIKTIGIYSLVGLPYALKFLWSPIMDRFVPPFLGRRRGWMFITQILLVITIAAMGTINPVKHPLLIAFASVLVAFFSASQDIVLDAFRTETLKPEERGAVTGVWIMGYRIAMITSGAFALILSDHLPWKLVYFIMASAMLIGIVATLLSKEPEIENSVHTKIAPPKNLYEAVVLPFLEFFKRKGALEVVAFVILYKFGEVAAQQMTTPFFLKAIGYTRTELGAITKGFGLFATIAGSIIGGALMSKWTLKKSLIIFGFFQGFVTLFYATLIITGKSTIALAAVIGIENLCYGMGTAAYVAFLMSICNKKFTATQYALLSSLMAVSRYITGAPTGYLVDYVGWIAFFVICTFAAIPGLYLLITRFDKWQITSDN